MILSAKIHISFILPGLFQPLGLWRKDFAFQPAAEHLLRLCSAVSMESSEVSGIENTLFHACGHPANTEIPFAYYRYLLDFDAPPEQALMCADPVWLQTGVDQVVLYPELPQISAAETEVLLALLNSHLVEDGLQLVAKHPQRWYLLGDKVGAQALHATPVSQALGQNIFQLLPQGDKRYWHRLLNEIQMLLHTSGIPAVNALWLWGASNPASLPSLHKKGIGGFIGSSVAAQSLAKATNASFQSTEKLADCRFESGQYYIVLEDLLIPSVSDNLQQWQQAMNKLEENWFAPALDGMKSGQFSVSLTACDGRTFHCQPVSAWKFWRNKPASWEQLI